MLPARGTPGLAGLPPTAACRAAELCFDEIKAGMLHAPALPSQVQRRAGPVFRTPTVSWPAAPDAGLAGDKRADVAQRAFNKPFAKITVNECGLL